MLQKKNFYCSLQNPRSLDSAAERMVIPLVKWRDLREVKLGFSGRTQREQIHGAILTYYI